MWVLLCPLRQPELRRALAENVHDMLRYLPSHVVIFVVQTVADPPRCHFRLVIYPVPISVRLGSVVVSAPPS